MHNKIQKQYFIGSSSDPQEPYFDPALSPLISLTKGEGSWDHVLTGATSPNNSPVSVSVDLDEASDFVIWDEGSQTLEISNLNDPSVAVGTYTLTITVSDELMSADTEVLLMIMEAQTQESETVEDDTQEAETQSCDVPPTLVDGSGQNSFTFDIDEATFVEASLPQYQAETGCEISYSIISADPDVPIATFARVELEEDGHPLLILENAGSQDVGVYGQVLVASVGASRSNLDFKFQIEVIGIGENDEPESSQNQTNFNQTESKTSDHAVVNTNFEVPSREQRQEQIIEPEYATCQLKSISQSGLVTIETSVAVISDQNFSEQGLEHLSIQYTQHSSSVAELEERLDQPTVTPMEFKDNLITVKLGFEQPLLISYGSFADTITIELDMQYFLVPQGVVKSQLEDGYLTLRAFLPKQVASQEQLETLESIGQQSKTIMSVAFMVPFVAQIGLKGVMSKLWLWINMMQVFTSFSFLKIDMPENVLIIEQGYTDIIDLQFLPKDAIKSAMGLSGSEVEWQVTVTEDGKNQTRRLSETRTEYADQPSKMDILLNRFNINQRNLIENLGSIIGITLGLGFVITALILVTRHCSHKLHPKVLTLVHLIKGKLMFNSILRYIQQQFFRIALATFFNVRLITLASVSALGLLLAVPSIVALVSFTVFSYVFMQRNKHRLHENRFVNSYGSLYTKVEIYNHNEALKYTFYFCLRRMAAAAVIAFGQISIVLQVLLLVQVALLMTSWAISVKPMCDTPNNLVFITNELVILVSSYLVLLFTRFVPSVEERYQFGFMYIGIFLLESAINLFMFVYISVKDLIHSYKLKKSKKLYQIRRQSVKLVPNETQVAINEADIRDRVIENFRDSEWLKDLQKNKFQLSIGHHTDEVKLVTNETQLEMSQADIREKVLESFKNSTWLKDLQKNRFLQTAGQSSDQQILDNSQEFSGVSNDMKSTKDNRYQSREADTFTIDVLDPELVNEQAQDGQRQVKKSAIKKSRTRSHTKDQRSLKLSDIDELFGKKSKTQKRTKI